MDNEVLRVEHLQKEFRTGSRTVKAVNDISFTLHRGEILGIVGESGSGKSTLARVITRLEKPDGGSVWIMGEDYTNPDKRKLRHLHGQMQMVFQNPQRAFNPRMSIGASIQETIRNFHSGDTREKEAEQLEEYLDMTGLGRELLNRYPSRLSGGQCQRAAIVRALCAGPGILIADEATSALDVLVQARIVELLRRIRDTQNMSMLFISHDLSLVSSICDRVMIMYMGKCVEQGNTREVIGNPQSAYTRKLLDSIL